MRVVIAEDSVLLRAGLVRLLHDTGAEVLAEVGDAGSLIEVLVRCSELPDLVLVDVRMPPTHTDEGIRAALEVRRRWPTVAVLVLSQYVEERYASDLLAGDTRGIGYLLKDRVADVEDFLAALHRVASGGTVLDPEVVSQLLTRARRRDPLASLSDREKAVLALMAAGESNAGIGAALFIGPGAVEKHIGNIFLKLDLPPVQAGHRRVLAVLRWLESS